MRPNDALAKDVSRSVSDVASSLPIAELCEKEQRRRLDDVGI